MPANSAAAWSLCLRQPSRGVLNANTAKPLQDIAFPRPPTVKSRKSEFDDVAGTVKIVNKMGNVPMMPKKMNIIARLIRRMPVQEALQNLQFSEKKVRKCRAFVRWRWWGEGVRG